MATARTQPRVAPRRSIFPAGLTLLCSVLAFLAVPRIAVSAEDKVVFLSGKLKDSSSFKVRLKAAVLLGRLADPRAVRPLVSALRDENYVVRGAAARALGNLGFPMAEGAIERLFRVVDDEEQFVRKEARQALERLASAQSLDYFVSALSNSRPSVRLAAIHILATLDEGEARVALIEPLGDEDEEVQAEAIVAVKGLGQAELEALLSRALVRKDSYRIQAVAARLAGESRMVSLMGHLADLLVSDEVVPEVKKEAAGALSEMKDKMDVVGLVDQLSSEDKSVQSRAIQLLGLHGGRDAVDALMDLLRHPDSYMRSRAVFALGDAGDPRAIPALEFLFESEGSARLKKLIERTLRKLRP